MKNFNWNLETEVSERTVGLGHLVHVFLALERAALIVVGIHDFGSQLVSHGLAATFAGIEDEVFHRYRLLAVRTDFSRHLEGGTAYAT